MHFYDIDLNVNIYRGVFRAQSSIYGEASFQASGVDFALEKIYTFSLFV